MAAGEIGGFEETHAEGLEMEMDFGRSKIASKRITGDEGTTVGYGGPENVSLD